MPTPRKLSVVAAVVTIMVGKKEDLRFLSCLLYLGPQMRSSRMDARFVVVSKMMIGSDKAFFRSCHRFTGGKQVSATTTTSHHKKVDQTALSETSWAVLPAQSTKLNT